MQAFSYAKTTAEESRNSDSEPRYNHRWTQMNTEARTAQIHWPQRNAQNAVRPGRNQSSDRGRLARSAFAGEGPLRIR